jgi:CubicO group peptidase (beta-lactamase class C family)
MMQPEMTDDLAREKLDHALAFFAKLLCSGVFVVGREADEFLAHDLKTHLRPEGIPFDWDEVAIGIDEGAGTVTFMCGGLARTAVYNAGQGCTIVPAGADGVSFTPVPVTPDPSPGSGQAPSPGSGQRLVDAAAAPWPIGDLLPDAPLPDAVDADALEAALARALDDSGRPVPQQTRAIVVVHQGRLIAERYAPGFGPDTRHVTWSMGKSITAALAGILAGDGCISIDDPAPVAEWRAPGDPRGAIRIRDLLNMSSGLQFLRAQDDDRIELGWTRFDDHMYIYYGAIDVFEHSISRPLEHPPGTVWRYRNGDTLTLGKIVRQTVEARGEQYLTFPQRALFERIGMRRMVLEPDPYGNFIMTGYDYGTARDWARFGLLHLWDGVWRPTGERILPAGWVDFVRAPAPADGERHYGGQFWLNAGGRLPRLPRDTFYPAGAWGQVVLIIPSRDMVIVRLGHSPTWPNNTFDTYLDETAGAILDTLTPPPAPSP